MKNSQRIGKLSALVALFAMWAPTAFANSGATPNVSSTDRQAIIDQFNKRPLSFESNNGQTDARVKFLSRGPGYTVFLTADEAVLATQQQAADARDEKPGKTTVLRMALVGANPNAQVKGLEELPGTANYILGDKQTQAHTYAKVKYESVYPGVDLVYYGNQSELEYDFVIAAGADPSKIRLSFNGAKKLRVDAKSGDLLVTAEDGNEVRHARPKVYQRVGGAQVEVAGRYEVLDGKQAAFTLASYNRKQGLVIDPTVSFTTFLAGSNQDQAKAVAVDGSGYSYVTGTTLSTNFPVVGISNYSQGGYDAFVTKLSPTGSIVFSTYLGGTGTDGGTGIALDGTGVYISGYTSSTNFPGSHVGAWASGLHAFVAKFTLSGSLYYATVLSGSSFDEANAIAVDASQNAYITGITYSTNFPVIGTWNTASHGGYDAFVAKINPYGNPVNSIYLGGASSDWANGIAVDSTGQVYVTGQTYSSDFPHTMPVSIVYGGNTFVAKINNTFTGFLYANILGGGNNYGAAITTDASGYAYVTGSVGANTYFPTTAGAYQTARPSPGGDAAFVSKFDTLGGLMYSTYLGGPNGSSDATSIKVWSGDIYVAGYTSSSNFPGAPVLTPNPTAGWVSKLTPTLNGLNYTQLLGATVNGIGLYQPRSYLYATDRYVYAAGTRYTGSITTTAQDAFVVKLDEPATTLVLK